MQPTLAEMTAWSADEIREAALEILPAGWHLMCGRDVLFWAVIQDTDGVYQWSCESPDERLLMLDVFGWLYLRGHRRSEGGPWSSRRRDITRRVMTASGGSFDDPPDLDPAELDAMYSRFTTG
jgi:hypothetical protein